MHPGLTLLLEFGAIGFGGSVQDALRGVAEHAGSAARRVGVGMAQHHLVHVDVAVIGGQLLRLHVGHGDLGRDRQDAEPRGLERHPGRGRDVDPVGHDRQDVPHVELEREEIALPADHVQWIVLVEDRAVPAPLD